MHGLVNRGLQSFICETQGRDFWNELTASLGVQNQFEAMLIYDDYLSVVLFSGAAKALNRKKSEILEDFGTYLVTSPNTKALRRLLRFSGVDYPDFLASLDDLPGRISLAMPEIALPPLRLIEAGENTYELHCGPQQFGMTYVLLGMLRALADDYGALVELKILKRSDDGDVLGVKIYDNRFSDGREFSLVERSSC